MRLLCCQRLLFSFTLSFSSLFLRHCFHRTVRVNQSVKWKLIFPLIKGASTRLWTISWQVIGGAEIYWFLYDRCKQEPLPHSCHTHTHTLSHTFYCFVNNIKLHLWLFHCYISPHTHTWMHADPETAASAYGRPGCLLSSNPSCCWGVFWVYSRAVVLQRLSDCHICVYVCVWVCLGDSGVAVRWLNVCVCVCGGLFKWNTARSRGVPEEIPAVKEPIQPVRPLK